MDRHVCVRMFRRLAILDRSPVFSDQQKAQIESYLKLALNESHRYSGQVGRK